MSDATLWTVIISLGVGSFLLRFSFLGFIGRRPMPDWLLRHLRYTAVAILPALVGPLVVWSEGPGSPLDPGQMLAAIVTVGLGRWTMNVFAGVLGGAATLALWVLLVG